MTSIERNKIRKEEQKQLEAFNFHPGTFEIIKNAANTFKGTGTTLESAIGAFIIGQLYGWRVLRVIHGSTTYTKYEKILGIKFKDYCEPESVLAKRSIGLRLADKIKAFWRVATRKVDTTARTQDFDEGTKDPEQT